MKLSRPNFLLVDFENLQNLDFSKLIEYNLTVVIFAGPNQKTVPIEWLNVSSYPDLKLQLVKTTRSGSNYLDIQIAAHAGAISERVKDAYFHILSNDSDFDSLIDWLKERGFPAFRSSTFQDLPFLKVTDAATEPDDEVLAAMRNHLTNLKSARPRKVKTLRTVLYNALDKKADQRTIDILIEKLRGEMFVTIGENESVTYRGM